MPTAWGGHGETHNHPSHAHPKRWAWHPAAANRRRKAAVALTVGIAVAAALQLALGIVAERALLLKDPGYADKELRLERQEAAHAGAPSVVMLGTSRTGFAFHSGRIRERLAPDLGGREIGRAHV